jgi:Mce-associated membrane protein
VSTPSAPRRRRIAGERRRPEGMTPEATAVERTPEPTAAAPRAPKPPKPPRAPRPARAGNPWPLFAVSAVLALALVSTALVLGLVTWNYRDVRAADAAQKAGESAASSAERAAAAILSFKYDTLDADLQAATNFLTPSFKKTYIETFNTYVRPYAPREKSTVAAKVLASAVVTADKDRAEILVYVDQRTVSTANGGDPQLALNRTTFTMVRRGGSWLVDGYKSY